MQARVVLPMAHTLPPACLVLVLEYSDLFAAQVLDHFGDDFGAVHQRSADTRVAIAAQEQHAQVDFGADVRL